MATLEQIQRAYEIARRDGDTEDIRVLETALRQAAGTQTSTRPSSEEIRRRYLESLKNTSDFRYSRPGFLENIGAGFGAGAVNVGELAALGGASLLEEEEELVARKKIQDFASGVRPEGGDPDSISYKLASGLGSIAGIAAPAFLAAAAPVSVPVAAGIGLGGTAALGIGAGAGEASERARAAGATEEERATATLRGAAIGSLEVIPLTRIFRRLPKLRELFEEGGEEVKENVGALRKLFREPQTALGRTGRTGLEEGAQEAAAGILQNLNERGYNVERELIDAGVLEEGAIGAGSGAILQAIVEAFTRGKPRGAPITEESPATEEEIAEEQQLLALPPPDPMVRVRMPDGSVSEVRASVLESARRREQEAIIENRALGLPAPDPDKLVQIRMPDGSVGEVRASEIAAATQRQQEALQEKERRRTELDTQIDALQNVEREEARTRGDEVVRTTRDGQTSRIPARLSPDASVEKVLPEGRARKTQAPTPKSGILTEERLNELGVRPSALVRTTVVNRDLNDPKVQERLRKFADNPRLGSKQARANVARLLEETSEEQLSPLDQQLLDVIQNKEEPLSDENFSRLEERLTKKQYGKVNRRVTDAFEALRVERQQAKEGTEVTSVPGQAREAVTSEQVTATPTTEETTVRKPRLGDDPIVRNRLNNLKKNLEDDSTFDRYSSANVNTIPDDQDPVTENDNKIVANKLKVGTKNNVEDKAIEAYLGRRERVIDGLDAAIYDLVVESEIDTDQEGRSEADKKFFANTGATVDAKSPDGSSAAGRVVAWAEKNLSKETKAWMEKRKNTLERQDKRLTAKRAGKDAVIRQREIEKGQLDISTQRARAKAELETYAQDDPFMTPAERRRAKRVMAAIDDFMDDMPYELRTRDVVLGIEIHPAAVAALKDGDIAGALRLVAATPDKDVARFARVFAKNIGDTKVELFSSTAEDSLAGSFDPKTNTIRLNTANGIRQHTLLHEVGHALTSATLANPSHPLTKQLNTLYNDVKDMLGTAYGTQSLDEFVAEAQSNRQFRAELAGINPDGSKVNALQRFLNSVGNFLRRLIGRNNKSIDSAVTQADALINEILAPAPESRDANILAMESTHDDVQNEMRTLGRIQKVVGKPLTKKDREEFKQSFKETVVGLGEQYGNIPLKFLDMSGFVDAARATNAKLGAVAQKSLVAMEEMRGSTALRIQSTREAIKPIERWFDNATPEQTKLINDIIYSREYGATIFQVDPTLSRAEAEKKYKGKPRDGNDLWAIWQENQKQWSKLDPEGKKVYEDMQTFYRKQFEELKEVIFSRIETMADGDTQTIAKLKTEFEKKLFDKKGMEVYFPLIREGRYKIGFRYKPGKTPKGQDNFVFEMHQNKSDWLAQLREIESNPDIELVRSSDNESFVNYAKEAPSTSFVNQTLRMMEGKNVNADVQEAFMRMVVSTLPESSLARSLQLRKNTAGHESDALYAIKTKGFDLGNQIEKLKFSGIMQNVLSDLDKVGKTEIGKFDPREQWTLNQSIEDLQGRIKFAMSGAKYKEVEGFVRVANQLAFVGTIGFNAASAIVQTAQIPMVVMPMMMAKYGVRPTLQAMYRAMRIVTSARNHRPEVMDFSKLSGKYFAEKATDLADEFSPAYGIDTYYKRVGDDFVVREDLDLTPDHIKELKEFAPLVKRASERGHLNRSFIADAIGLLEGARAQRNDTMGAKLLSGLDTGTAISAMMFNQAERFNRQVSMLMSYDLAKQEAAKTGKRVDNDTLIENAFRETHQLNGGSTLETAPPVVRANIGRVAGMYKTYGMRMYTTMFNVGATAFGVYNNILRKQGVPDAEIKQRMAIARNQAFGILGSSVFFSGIHGVPLYGAFQLVHDLFSPDEDDDLNTKVRNYVGEGWYKGAVNKALSEAGVGVDVASRIRLTGLLLQTNRYNNDPSIEETFMYYAGGPAWSVFKRAMRGKDDILEGEFQRGLENILPVGISNAYKVLDRYQEDGGVYSRRGDPIYDDITGGEMVGQFFGFAPSEYTRIQENNQRVKRIDNALSRRMSKLRKKYYLAYRQGDFSALLDVKQAIREHNINHPSFKITPDSIKRSMKQHMKTSAEMYNGVTLSPAMRGVLNDQLEAERNGFIAPE